MADQITDILRRHTQIQSDIIRAHSKLNRERKKLAKFYEEVGNLIKEGMSHC